MLKILTVNVIFIIIILLVFEISLRYFSEPIFHGGTYHDPKTRLPIKPGIKNTLRMRSNIKFIHKSSEFEALATSNQYGFRTSRGQYNETIDHLFLGDSFTFGHGIDDGRHFVDLFCNEYKQNCLNISSGGADQYLELLMLKRFLGRHKKNFKNINIIMLASCDIDSAGNDLGTNINEYNSEITRKNNSRQNIEADTTNKFYISIRDVQKILYHSELIKRLLQPLISRIKFYFNKCSDITSIVKGAKITNLALNEIRKIAESYNAKMNIFVIFPYQYLENTQIVKDSLLKYAGSHSMIFTDKYIDKTGYYKFDGHFNEKGHKMMYRAVSKYFRK